MRDLPQHGFIPEPKIICLFYRYSLNGKPGYVSGGSTMNSTRSISTNSDHYAIVHSRPGSRYSPGQKNGHRGPSSNLGSHYSGKM